MYVVKRKGNTESVNLGKIQSRIEWIASHPYVLKNVNPIELAQLVIVSLRNGIRTSEIDTYTSELAASISVRHPDYGVLAGRITINNHHKNTLNSFRDKIEYIYKTNPALISDQFYKYVSKHHLRIDREIDYERDYDIDYFGFKTLEKGYLLREEGRVVERPQDLFMRVAVQLHMDMKDASSLERVCQVYQSLSKRLYVHATPTLFNSGNTHCQLASCFLMGTEDSLEGIMKTATDMARISKWAGGIGVHVSSLRGKGTHISGTNGKTKGIINFLRIYETVALAFDQGSTRNGSFAIYLEPHHPDIMEFLEMRNIAGNEKLRCKDLYMAVWISDLFMKRVEEDGQWSLFTSTTCPDLQDLWGEEYEKRYLQYESESKYVNQVSAREVWKAIFKSQKESGMPYICYKDTVNKCSMQKNVGTIKSSNLCSEIVLYSDANEYAVCILASICLPQFVRDTYTDEEFAVDESVRRELNHTYPVNPQFDFNALMKTVQEVVVNLNNVIERNWYPTIETVRSNFKNRPLGIGVQGLADVYIKCRFPFESDEAKQLNKRIFEAIYYAALSKSSELCRYIYFDARQQIENGKSYAPKMFPKELRNRFPSLKREELKVEYTTIEELPKTVGAYANYDGSPLQQGSFHWELAGLDRSQLSGMFDWETLRNHIQIYGVRNSTLVSLMPTASTSQIMGSSICFEPYMSNMYKRQTLAGEYIIINKHMMYDLDRMGLWNDEIRAHILANDGSIQYMENLPDSVKNLYKTAWEIKQKCIVQQASDRQPFVDQSQSMNLHCETFTFERFNAVEFYAWKQGLKTGSYYVRTRSAGTAQKFTVDPDIVEKATLEKKARINYEEQECLMCGS